MKVDAKLHYHSKSIHIEFFEDDKLIEHSCIAHMNGHNDSPLMSIFTEQICRRWNSQDILVKALKFCREKIHSEDVYEQDSIDCVQVIDTALEAIGKPLEEIV